MRAGMMWWTALFGWATVILWLSSLTPAEMPDSAFLIWDKLSHFTFYALGGWLAASALRASRPRAGAVGIMVAAVILIGTFGILDEAFQTLTPGRTGGDVDDWFADVLGATAGALLTLAVAGRSPFRRTPAECRPPRRQRQRSHERQSGRQRNPL